MNRIQKLVDERNELADGITYVRSALEAEDLADEDFAAGADYCRTGIDRLAELDELRVHAERVVAMAGVGEGQPRRPRVRLGAAEPRVVHVDVRPLDSAVSTVTRSVVGGALGPEDAR